MSYKTCIYAILIIIITLIVEISTGINYIIFPLSIKQLVESNSLVGLAMSCEILSIIIFCSFINRFLQFFGIARSIIITVLLRTVILYFVQFMSSYYQWVLLIFIYGLTTNVLRLALQTWLNLLPLRKMKGFFLGLYSAVLSLGVALGPFLLKLTDFTPKGQMLFNSLLSFSVLFIGIILKKAPEINIKEKNRIYFVFKNAKIIMISALVGGIVFFGLPAFLTIYGLESGLSEGDAAVLLTSFMIGSVFLGMVISSLTGIISDRVIIIICVFNSLVCSFLLPIAIYDYRLSLLLLFFWGGNAGGLYATGLAMIGQLFRVNDQVSANMTYSIMDAFGGLIGLCCIGVAMDLIGGEGLTYIIVASSVSFFLYVLSRYQFR